MFGKCYERSIVSLVSYSVLGVFVEHIFLCNL